MNVSADRPQVARPVSDLLATLRLAMRASRTAAVAVGLLTLVRALISMAFIITVGTLVGAVSNFSPTASDRHRLWLQFGVLAALWLAKRAADPASTLLVGWLTRRCAEFVSEVVLDASLGPSGIGHLEDPAFADKLSLAQGLPGSGYPPQTVIGPCAQVLTSRLSAVAAAVLLGRVLWWAPIPLIVGWIMLGSFIGRQFRSQLDGLEQQAGRLRMAAYLRELGTGLVAAKEIRLLGMADWLLDRFHAYWCDGMREVFTSRGHDRMPLLGRAILLVLGYLAVFGWLGYSGGRGQVSVEQLTVTIQASITMAAFGWAGDAQLLLAGASASCRQALELAASVSARDRLAAPSIPSTARSTKAADCSQLPQAAIRFESVTFRYPSSSTASLRALDLEIEAGRSLAIVGENGAGKTTLVKLLTGLYHPDSGAITVDGRPLTELESAAWARQLAVIFQDFVRYELTARENVCLGGIGQPVNQGWLTAAAQQANASEVIAGLPHGWDTILSRQFGEMELSGGQWQRLALARALYAVQAGARVLVLDEPTAQLDPRAESELYERFLETTRGLTTILISHRFNTVRLADRIVVLENGRVAELGSHAELLAADGRYAAMFHAQAERMGVR